MLRFMATYRNTTNAVVVYHRDGRAILVPPGAEYEIGDELAAKFGPAKAARVDAAPAKEQRALRFDDPPAMARTTPKMYGARTSRC